VRGTPRLSRFDYPSNSHRASLRPGLLMRLPTSITSPTRSPLRGAIVRRSEPTMLAADRPGWCVTCDRKLRHALQWFDAERLCKGPAGACQCRRSRAQSGHVVGHARPASSLGPSASYHADPSVGTSILKHILQATVEWWHSHMNHRRRTPQPCKSDGPCTSWCWRLGWRGLKEMDRASATTSAL
jgi:hypothetical protein